MSNSEPFRSRPRVDREPARSEPRMEPATDGEPEAEVVEGYIEESAPRAIVQRDQVDHTLHLPEDDSDKTRLEQPGLFLIAMGMVIGGIFLTVLRNVDLPDSIEQWWPMVSLIVAILWSFVSLWRRDVRAFLGGAVVAGISVSLLLDAQDIARFQETVIGIILMTFGLAIVMRGLLLRSVKTV